MGAPVRQNRQYPIFPFAALARLNAFRTPEDRNPRSADGALDFQRFLGALRRQKGIPGVHIHRTLGNRVLQREQLHLKLLKRHAANFTLSITSSKHGFPVRVRRHPFHLCGRGEAPINMQLHHDLFGSRQERIRRATQGNCFACRKSRWGIGLLKAARVVREAQASTREIWASP